MVEDTYIRKKCTGHKLKNIFDNTLIPVPNWPGNLKKIVGFEYREMWEGQINNNKLKKNWNAWLHKIRLWQNLQGLAPREAHYSFLVHCFVPSTSVQVGLINFTSGCAINLSQWSVNTVLQTVPFFGGIYSDKIKTVNSISMLLAKTIILLNDIHFLLTREVKFTLRMVKKWKKKIYISKLNTSV